MATRKRVARQTITTGPWRGVQDTRDPYDDSPEWLVDAVNGYIPDTQAPSGFYARPGFSLLNAGTAIYSSGSDFRTTGGYTHIALDGTAYNFVVMGGHLFRVDTTLSTFTDVSPVGITISPAITSRVKFVSLDGELVVSDGVNRPWIATNLASTPITGTYIDFDSLGTTWSAQDIAAYSGALVVLMNQLNSVYAKTDIAWSAPGDPATGYQQTTYDYRWTLEQTGSEPIYAIHGTNVGLYYWRRRSIGLAVGALGPNFQTTHTDDAIAANVGSQSPQTIIGFTDRIFFTDSIGRPWMLPLGGRPEAIWQSMRAVIDDATITYPEVTAITSTAAFESTLQIYCVGIWSTTPLTQTPITEWFVFDARTGIYLGRWNITSATGSPIAIETLCTFVDNHGRSVLMAFGSKAAAPAVGGYAWSFNALLGVPDFLTTEAMVLLTTEGGSHLTSEGQEDIWMDNAVVPSIAVTTPRLGYSDDYVWNVDRATVTTGTDAPVAVTMQTSTTSGTIEGTPTPAVSEDDTYRCVVGADVQGRGTQVTVSPTTAAAQWSVQRVSIVAVPSLAGPEDA